MSSYFTKVKFKSECSVPSHLNLVDANDKENVLGGIMQILG